LNERRRFLEVAVKTSFGPFVFDRTRQLLVRDGQEVPLPPRVLGVLDVLVGRAGQIVSKQELIETVWKDAFVSDTSLSEAISFLRQALGDDPQQPRYIQTVHRRGYRFLATSPEAIDVAPMSPTGTSTNDVWMSALPWAVAVVLFAVAVSALWRLSQPNDPVALPEARFDVEWPAGTMLDASGPAIATSADGSRIAFTACAPDGCRIYARALGDTETRTVAGTLGGGQPFLSPDGTQLGFFAEGQLRKVAVSGGAPITIADVRQPRGAVWLDDGSIVVSASASGALGGLLRVTADGGSPRVAADVDTHAGEVALAWPDALPGGRVLIASAMTSPDDPSSSRIVAVSSMTGVRSTLIDHATFARFVPPSTLVFVQDGTLMGAAFDASQLKIAGQPVALGVRVGARAPQFAVSRVGTMIAVSHVPVDADALSWRLRDGGIERLLAPRTALTSVSLARDGRRLAGLTGEEPRADLWSADVERGTLSRLTFDGEHRSPVWSADGRTIVFASRVDGVFNLYARTLDSSDARRLATASRHQLPSSVSPDGRVAFTEYDPSTGEHVMTIPIGGGNSSPLVRSSFDDASAAFSPDGGWVVYQSNETTRWEVYARSSRHNGAAVPISAGGGVSPVWSADGRRILYAGPRGVMSVAVTACGSSDDCDLAPSRPAEIVRGRWLPKGEAPDGRLLLEAGPDRDVPSGPIRVTLQWPRELQRLVPRPVVSTPK